MTLKAGSKVTQGNGVTSITQLRNCVMKILPNIILFEVCTDSVPRPSKCTEIVGGWGFSPDPTGGAYSAPPDPLAGLKGPTSKGPTSKGRGGEERGGAFTA